MTDKTLTHSSKGALPRRRVAVTTSDIAREAGVSTATVSHVLNGRATELRIRPETQERVLRTVKELGYLPNASARAVRTGRFDTVVLFQAFDRVYLPSGLILGITEAIEERNYHLSVARLPQEALTDSAFFPKATRELIADGLLINPLVGVTEMFLNAIKEHHLPALWINMKLDSDCVHPDDFSGGKQAAEYLLGLGHTRIAFAMVETPGEGPHYSVQDRWEGYCAAMTEAGLPVQQFVVEQFPNDQRIFQFCQLLQAANRPTAIIAYEQEVAVPVLLAAREVGLRVPEDVSLIVCHEHMDTTSGIAITTMEHNMWNVGRVAVEMLDEKRRDPEKVLPPVATPVVMKSGQTCAPPLK